MQFSLSCLSDADYPQSIHDILLPVRSRLSEAEILFLAEKIHAHGKGEYQQGYAESAKFHADVFSVERQKVNDAISSVGDTLAPLVAQFPVK